jgi:hypothetical protein
MYRIFILAFFCIFAGITGSRAQAPGTDPESAEAPVRTDYSLISNVIGTAHGYATNWVILWSDSLSLSLPGPLVSWLKDFDFLYNRLVHFK